MKFAMKVTDLLLNGLVCRNCYVMHTFLTFFNDVGNMLWLLVRCRYGRSFFNYPPPPHPLILSLSLSPSLSLSLFLRTYLISIIYQMAVFLALKAHCCLSWSYSFSSFWAYALYVCASMPFGAYCWIVVCDCGISW